MTSTRYIYPKEQQVVMVDIGHAFPVPRRYFGTNALGQHVFLDLETKRFHEGHCTWAPKEPEDMGKPKECTGCAKCSPDNCCDIAPRAGCVEPKKWIDSRKQKPAATQAIWFTDGPGKKVYEGVNCTNWRGNYFWQPRQVVEPPAPMPAKRPDGWIWSGDEAPPIGQLLWFWHNTRGVLPGEVVEHYGPNCKPGVKVSHGEGINQRYTGDAFWQPRKPEVPPAPPTDL